MSDLPTQFMCQRQQQLSQELNALYQELNGWLPPHHDLLHQARVWCHQQTQLVFDGAPQLYRVSVCSGHDDSDWLSSLWDHQGLTFQDLELAAALQAIFLPFGQQVRTVLMAPRSHIYLYRDAVWRPRPHFPVTQPAQSWTAKLELLIGEYQQPDATEQQRQPKADAVKDELLHLLRALCQQHADIQSFQLQMQRPVHAGIEPVIIVSFVAADREHRASAYTYRQHDGLDKLEQLVAVMPPVMWHHCFDSVNQLTFSPAGIEAS